jgi:hypothetical protein
MEGLEGTMRAQNRCVRIPPANAVGSANPRGGVVAVQGGMDIAAPRKLSRPHTPGYPVPTRYRVYRNRVPIDALAPVPTSCITPVQTGFPLASEASLGFKKKSRSAVGRSGDTSAHLSPIENRADATSSPLKASTSSDNRLCSTTGGFSPQPVKPASSVHRHFRRRQNIGDC